MGPIEAAQGRRAVALRRCTSACARVLNRPRAGVRSSLVVDVARPCVPVAAATVAIYYQNVTTSTLHAIGPHRTIVPLDHPVFRYFIAISLLYDFVSPQSKLLRTWWKQHPRFSRTN